MLLQTPAVETGLRAAEFALPDADGNITTQAEVAGRNGLLVAFICNHCPYVQAIIGRLAADAAELLQAGVGVVGIMPNDYREYPEDSPANMKKFAAAHQLPFPYLVDAEQTAARAYGAVCTPDFFGFNRAGELQYRGRLDDLTMGEMRRGGAHERRAELLNAMRQIAATGAGPAKQTPSMGCSIKWKAAG